MMRQNISMVLGGIVATVVFTGIASNPGRLGLVSKAHAQDDSICSVASLKGAYGFYRTGTTPGGPLAAVGIATFDGSGNSTARQTIRKNGVTTSDLFQDPPIAGPYQVDPDCGARFLMPDGSVFAHGVVVSGGKELIILSLSDTNTIYGVMKKIGAED